MPFSEAESLSETASMFRERSILLGIALFASITLLFQVNSLYSADLTPSTILPLDQMVAGWSTLQHLASQTAFTVVQKISTTQPGVNAKLETRKLTFDYAGGDFLVKVGDNETWGGNPKYVFTVRRTLESSPWTVGFVSSTANHDVKTGDEYYGGIPRMPWTILSAPMKDLVTDPTFEVLGTEDVPGSAAKNISIEFKLSSSDKTVRNLSKLSHGRVVLDPHNNWAVCSYDIYLVAEGKAKPSHITSIMEYGPPSPDFLNIRHNKHSMESEGAKGMELKTWDTDFTSCAKCNLTPTAFMLSAFNVPEPVLEGGGAKFWIGLNVAGVLIIVLAFWLRRRFNRKTPVTRTGQ